MATVGYLSLHSFLPEPSLNVTIVQGLPGLPTPCAPLDAAHNGLSYLSPPQLSNGQWAWEFGGPMLLLMVCIIGLFVMNLPIPST